MENITIVARTEEYEIKDGYYLLTTEDKTKGILFHTNNGIVKMKNVGTPNYFIKTFTYRPIDKIKIYLRLDTQLEIYKFKNKLEVKKYNGKIKLLEKFKK